MGAPSLSASPAVAVAQVIRQMRENSFRELPGHTWCHILVVDMGNGFIRDLVSFNPSPLPLCLDNPSFSP